MSSLARSFHRLLCLWSSVSSLAAILNVALTHVAPGLGYMMISPIINGIACIAFFFSFFVWKYLFLWQLDQPASGDTGGLFFPKAIQHIFVGLYIQQVCLAALFFLAGSGKVMGILTVVLIGFTALFHMIINNSYGPLLHSLPLTLAHRSHGMKAEAHSQEDVPGEDQDDFGGTEDGSQQDEGNTKPNMDKENPPSVSGTTEGIVQSNRGPEPSKEYGASVPVEGKRNEGPTDFNHPASVEPQRIIWIPADPLGLGEIEARALNAVGVEAGTEHATMDDRGRVDIDSHPPGSNPNAIFG
jgi:calcium permeable stress-gated cation channel